MPLLHERKSIDNVGSRSLRSTTQASLPARFSSLYIFIITDGRPVTIVSKACHYSSQKKVTKKLEETDIRKMYFSVAAISTLLLTGTLAAPAELAQRNSRNYQFTNECMNCCK